MDFYEADLEIAVRLAGFIMGFLTPEINNFEEEAIPDIPEDDQPEEDPLVEINVDGFFNEDEIMAALNNHIPEEELRQAEVEDIREIVRHQCHNLCHACMKGMETLDTEAVQVLMSRPPLETQCMVCFFTIRPPTDVPVGFINVRGELHPCYWLNGIAFSRQIGHTMKRVTEEGIEES